MKAVSIMVGDDGNVSVGAMPKEMMAQMMGGGGKGMMAGGEKGGMMQPAESVDSALEMAKQILAAPAEGGEAAEMGPAMAPGGGQMMGRMSAEDRAWNRVSADRKVMA